MQKIIYYIKRLAIPGIILVLIIVILLIVRGCGNKDDLTYEYAKVTVGEVKRTISVSGNLEVMNIYTVLSKIDGIITKVNVDFNQKVKKGQLLATIDASKIDQELMKISASLEKARLELATVKKELDAKKNMFKENLISKSEMQQAEIKYKSQYAAYRQIQIDYNLAAKNRNATKIYSPISGIVLSRNIDKNVPVRVNQQVFELAPNLKKMRLLINIDETDRGVIKEKQRVVFTVGAYPEKIFEGNISQVRMMPVKTNNLVTYQAVVSCDNSELLLMPGMTATATVIVGEKKNVLRIQKHAFGVTPPGEQYDATVLWKRSSNIGDSLKKIKVKTGLMGDMYTEILDSLKKGDQILIKVNEEKTFN